MKNIRTIPILFLLFLCFFLAVAQEKTDPSNQSEELGKISWYRDYDEAIAIAQKEEKDILILFQEVPGCMTCRNYGHQVLSYPLLAEAAENIFVPLAIYNNKKGKDLKILQKYKEPTWNNPVVRIINTEGENIVNRVANNYSMNGLFDAMKKAIDKSDKAMPAYLKIFEQELKAHTDGSKILFFKMYCFWSGESHFGNIEGVVATEPGFKGGYEVVKVNYDPNVISKEELVKHAAKANCELLEKKGNYRKDKDPQYYLKNSDFKYLPLSPLQKTKINHALHHRLDGKEFLSPKQLYWLKNLNTSNPKKRLYYDIDFYSAWQKMK